MTTYNSYEEAKIANPESEIYKLASGYIATNEPQGISVHRCNPADHCMSVEEFLARGHKLIEGDVYLDYDGEVVEFICVCDNSQSNTNRKGNDVRFILRAAALKEKPKRVKVEYVNADFSKEWKAVRYYNEVGELFVVDFNGNYSNVNDTSGTWYEVVCKNYDSLFIRIEAEIDERQEFIDEVERIGAEVSSDGEWSFACLAAAMIDSGFKLVEGE